MRGCRLVIFGCGYVGRSLAGALSAAGHEVWIHSRNADSLSRVNGVPVDHKIVAHLQSPDWHDRLPGHWDAAINLVSSAGGGLDGYRLSYLEGNRSIRDWALNCRVDRFIYTSATSVYPQTDGQWVGEEEVPEIEQLSPSGQILRQAELELMGDEIIPTRVIARLGGIYGPGRHLYLDRLREGEARLPGNGASWLNLIYLSDIVDVLQIMAFASMAAGSHVFNVVDNAPARKQEIVDWLASESGLKGARFDPDLAGARAIRRQVAGDPPNRRVRNEKVRQVLGWEPRFPDYRAGYRDILSSG